ncbi:MAG: hypothetical protein ACPF8V_10810, partial [Luteibaculum sp.]
MFSTRINVLKELEKQRMQDLTLGLAKSALQSASETDSEINQSIKKASGLMEIDASNLEEDKLYQIQDIKQVAIKYRLRFLPIKLFKQDLPRNVFLKLKHLKEEHHFIEDSLYVLAPGKMFNLENVNQDPLLFAQTNTGQYYFIAKWGDDLNALRMLSSLPFRSMETLIGSAIVLGFILGLLVGNVVHENVLA